MNEQLWKRMGGGGMVLTCPSARRASKCLAASHKPTRAPAGSFELGAVELQADVT
jgi:hypothetical protein